jgi:hypothetical protein
VGIVKSKIVDKPTFCPYAYLMPKTGRPKKKPEAVKADYIEVRCGEAEKRAFRTAAEAAGLPLSGWIRERLRRGWTDEETLSPRIADRRHLAWCGTRRMHWERNRQKST